MRSYHAYSLFGLGLGNLVQTQQHPFASLTSRVQEVDPSSPEDIFKFPHQIRRVAVIGAGPSGLQAASALIEHGFEVRLFERRANPGGNWQFAGETTPIQANFPNKPLEVAAYTPDIPPELPCARVLDSFADSEAGRLDWMLREHWDPSPVWRDLTSNSMPAITTLPGVVYPEDTNWLIPQQTIQRHVRQYASLHGLNSNDEELGNVTSYSTRVEQIHKPTNSTTWTLTLKQLTEIRDSDRSGFAKRKLRFEWWTESFDAIVVATKGSDSTYIPPIPNLSEWALAYPNQIYHSRNYRVPEKLKGKNVLIVGGSVSASEIARNLMPHVANFSISLRHHDNFPSIFRQRSFQRLPMNITHLAQIKSFSELPQGGMRDGIQHLTLSLVDGTNATGFHEVIFATGFRRSNPFLAGFHNTSIIGTDEPEVDVPPILTDGTHLRSLHWTGHYIPDPTLAFASMGRPWTLGRYQSLAIAKIWSGKADLPGVTKMWETYPAAGKDIHQVDMFGSLEEEATERLWVTWLNNASLKYGGRLVSPWPTRHREEFVYYADKAWVKGYATSENFTRNENTPRSQWPSRDDPLTEGQGVLEDSAFEVESVETADPDGTVKVWGNFIVGQW